MSRPSKPLKNYCGTIGKSSHGMLKKATFSPAQPWRAKTRLVPSKAAASEGPEAYPRGTLRV